MNDSVQCNTRTIYNVQCYVSVKYCVKFIISVKFSVHYNASFFLYYLKGPRDLGKYKSSQLLLEKLAIWPLLYNSGSQW